MPEFRVSYTVNTDALDALYKRLKPKGVTMTALLAKAAGVALVSHPVLYAGTTADLKGIGLGRDTAAFYIKLSLAVLINKGKHIHCKGGSELFVKSVSVAIPPLLAHHRQWQCGAHVQCSVDPEFVARILTAFSLCSMHG